MQAINEYSESEPSILQTANVINRLVLFGFSASDSHALACLKNAALTSSYLNLFIHVFKGPTYFEETSDPSYIRY